MSPSNITRIALCSLILAFMVALPVFAQTAPTPTSATPAPATQPATTTPDPVVCMQAAIERRDSTIIIATQNYSTSVTTALQARKDALKTAWAITNRPERRKALRMAWNNFQGTWRKASAEIKQARLKTWQIFATDRRACGRIAVTDDVSHRGLDVQP